MAEEIWYKPAEVVEKIALDTVIPQWHEHLKPLNILYVFVSKLPKKHGKAVLAKTKKMTPLEHYLGGETHDYAMLVSFEYWDDMNHEQHVALIDHELSHIIRDVEADSGFSMRMHDIEEFTAVVERHGAWKADVRNFLSRTREAQLDMFEPAHNGHTAGV